VLEDTVSDAPLWLGAGRAEAFEAANSSWPCEELVDVLRSPPAPPARAGLLRWKGAPAPAATMLARPYRPGPSAWSGR